MCKINASDFNGSKAHLPICVAVDDEYVVKLKIECGNAINFFSNSFSAMRIECMTELLLI